MGRAIIKPDSSGFFPESQLAKAMTKAANKTFDKKIIVLLVYTIY
jgi:hypothetical protein